MNMNKKATEVEDNVYLPHEMWVTTGEHGEDEFMSFEFGRGKYDAPILVDQKWIFEHLSHLEGEILTIVEATVVKDQQKGAKDLVRRHFGVMFSDVVNATQTDEYTEFMIRECNQSEFKK